MQTLGSHRQAGIGKVSFGAPLRTGRAYFGNGVAKSVVRSRQQHRCLGVSVVAEKVSIRPLTPIFAILAGTVSFSIRVRVQYQ